MALRWAPRLLGLAVMVLLLAGCGSRKPLPKTAPVKGKVVDAKGNPLTGGNVTFEPKSTGENLSIVGAIGSDGSFEMETFREKDRQKGAPPGEYVVKVQLPIPGGGNMPPPVVTLRDPVKVPEEGLSDLELKLPASAK